MDLVEQDQAQDLADAGDRLQQLRTSAGSSTLARFGQVPFQPSRSAVVVRRCRSRSACDARRRAAASAKRSAIVGVAVAGVASASCRTGGRLYWLLVFWMWAMSWARWRTRKCGAAAGRGSARWPADRRRPCGKHAAAQQAGDLGGVDRVVLGLAAVDGLHVQGVAEDEGDALVFAEVGEPVPGEHALAADDQVRRGRARWRRGRRRARRAGCWSKTVCPSSSRTCRNMRSGVQIDAAVESVLVGCRSAWSWPPWGWAGLIPHRGCELPRAAAENPTGDGGFASFQLYLGTGFGPSLEAMNSIQVAAPDRGAHVKFSRCVAHAAAARELGCLTAGGHRAVDSTGESQMLRLTVSTILTALLVTRLSADNDPSGSLGGLTAYVIRDEYRKARDELGKDVRAGKIKPNADGEFPGWADLSKRFVKCVQEVIDADPADAVGLDAPCSA